MIPSRSHCRSSLMSYALVCISLLSHDWLSLLLCQGHQHMSQSRAVFIMQGRVTVNQT